MNSHNLTLVNYFLWARLARPRGNIYGAWRAASKTACVLGVLCALAQWSCRADLLAYEGFNYFPGNSLAGQNGGTGWGAAWANVGGGSLVNPSGLTADRTAPAGYDARSAGNAAFTGNACRVGRGLDCSAKGNFGGRGFLDGNGRIGADGKTLYVSFLQQPSAPGKFYEFEFHRADLGDPGRVAGIGNDVDFTTVNLRAPNTQHTPLGPGNTNVNFYIVRIDFKPGNDDVLVYRNPTGDTEADNEPCLTMTGVADLAFDGISLAAYLNGVTVKHDEIRLGETWSDVLGGPPAFVLQPTNQNSYVGQTVTLAALAGSRQPIQYQWYRNGSQLPGATNANLVLAHLQFGDTGDYSVMATNVLGQAVSAVAKVQVQVLTLDLPATAVLVGAGTNLTISAVVGGSQPVALQWYQDGVALAGQTNAGLALGAADFFAAGHYVLVAQNTYGAVTSSVVTVCANLGGLLAYEGFDYATGDLAGQIGGLGWNGGWSTVGGGAATVLAGSLAAGSNGPAGLEVHSAGNAAAQPGTSRSGRWLDCSPGGNFGLRGYVNEQGNLGVDGKTLYVSFLQQPNGTALFYEFEFHRGDLGDAGRMAGIGNDTTGATVNFRAPNGTQTPLGAGSTAVNFYVVRIDYQAGNDIVTVYRNPTGTNEAANVPVLTLAEAGDMSFNGLSVGAYLNNRTVKTDEIRVGMTWSDVVGETVAQLQMAGGGAHAAHVRLAASPHYAYQLQGAAELPGPWSEVARLVMPAVGAEEWVETNLAAPHRFYRALTEPVVPVISADTVFADFEGATYGAWVSTGSAFGSGPAAGTLANQNPVSGYQGQGLVNSYNQFDAGTGTLTSPVFTITAHYLNFLIGGGNQPGQTCMNLLVNGTVVRTASGANSETLAPVQWDVSDYLGQPAVLQIVDTATGSWGHVLVDQVVQTEVPFPVLVRQLVLTNDLLNLPVKNGAAYRRFKVTVGGVAVRDFDIPLADGVPDWWAFVDVSAFRGQTATLSVDSLPPGSMGLAAVLPTNGIIGATNLYQESGRPQLHFSSRRGWLNDPNGMLFYQGAYHLYYQHDPYTWNGDHKHWGHAASPDMVRWHELPEAIYPHAYHDDVWSGSAVVDRANTGGFKTGTNDVMVAAYTSTGRGECIAFSNDGGLTFTDYTNNPVVVHSGRDPHLLWYAPSNYWVMALYDYNGNDGIAFYSSTNLRAWTYRSRLAGFFECPDLFQLPVDGQPDNRLWVLSDAGGGYRLGQFDGAVFTPATAKLPGNSGVGFYAAQTFSEMPGGDARRVRMGWAQIALPGMPFNQQLYFPTEVTLRTTADGVRQCSQPVAEITNLCANQYAWTNLTVVPGANPLAGIRGALFNLRAQFTPGAAQQIDFTFQGRTISYRPATQQITCNGTTGTLAAENGVVQLQILVDRTTVEIFGNRGLLYMPLPAGPLLTNGVVSITCQGGAAVFGSLVVEKLHSAWSPP